MKKLLLVLAALGLMAQFSACTANKAQDDAEFVENADVDKIESEEPKLDDGSAQASNDQNLSTDSSLEAALGEAPADTTASADPTLDAAPPQDPPPSDIAAAPTLDESSLDAPPADIAAEPPADSLAASDLPPQDATLDDPNALAPTDDLAMNDPGATPQDTATSMAPPPAAKTQAPIEATPTTSMADIRPTTTGSVSTASLKKVSDAVPYAFDGGFVNTIYIARPKEKLKDISMNIFGTDKTKELKKINSFLKARPPRAGDKIAYVSPNRPTDSSKTITYYEDTGMVPETYVAAKGDNLRKVSKKLLGYDNAWKEVWSTNSIESKGKLAEGETFKYWKSPASITTPVASNMPKSPEAAVNNIVKNNPTEMAPPPQPGNDLPPPPPQADLPPPPNDPMAAHTAPNDPGLEANMPPPPPPDDAQFAQTPPPPPPDAEAKPNKAPAGDGEDAVAAEGAPKDDMMMMLGVGVVVFGILAFILVKRKKAQANRNNSNDIQMGEGLGT